MANAQICYQGPADAKCTPALDFKVGDQAYVKAKYFQSTRPSKKLSEKNLGPYTIIAQVSSLSFTLCLPDSMRCRGGLGVAAASGEARSTQGLLEVWQSSQGLGRLEELGRVVVVQSLQD